MDATITSVSNPLIKQFKKLHRARRRREAAQTIVEGSNVFGLAIGAGIKPVAVLVLEEDKVTRELAADRGFPIMVVTEEVMKAAADSANPQGPVALIDVPAAGSIRPRDTLVLRDIADPGNVGTMIRSAAAFGWDVCVSGSTADAWSPKVLRSGVGTHFGVHLASTDNPVLDAHAVGLEVIATVVADGGESLRGDRPIALMIGSETHGLSRSDIEQADRTVTLNMPGAIESLNAAVAGSILMYTLTDDR
ncbi:MAG: RNA methyltransferase [Acidimicrobiia bacterium]|nr:MAG: RNA methyltransferase [Acidimicrobiia bacterium]